MSYLSHTLEYPPASLSVWLPDEGIGIVALQGATGAFRPYSNRINTESLNSGDF